MSTHSWRFFAASAVTLFLSGPDAFAVVTDSGIHPPPEYDTFLPPAVGAIYTDPVFGTTAKRLSDAVNMLDNAGRGDLEWVSTEYSTASPFSSDKTWLILEHQSYFGLYDGNGKYLRDLPLVVNASAEPRWSRVEPNVLFYVNGNALFKLDVSTGWTSLVHEFSEYARIGGMGESDISKDGDHFVFAGDQRYVFVFEISTDRKGPVLDTSGHSFNDLYIAPNNSVAIGWIPTGTARFAGVELFDSNMTFERQLTHALGHMHLTQDTNGDEVLIWTNSNDPVPIANCQNGVVKVRLSDAHQSCLLQLDWSLAVHITAGDGNGWAFVETYAPSNPLPSSAQWVAYTNELLQVKLDGTQTLRLLHHRSRPYNSYNYQPRATVSRDSTKLVFTSNYDLQGILGYGSQYSDVYFMNVPKSTSTAPPQPIPGPSATPAPSPSTTPPPTTPPSSSARYEQDSSAVTYSGSWSQDKLAIFSGGSAALSMEAGAKATFVFYGTGATWIGYRDQWSGIALVTLDGAVKGTLNTYASPQQARATLYSITKLPNGRHSLTIEATGTRSGPSAGSWVWVDAFLVFR
jgi:hypothetical protein